MMDQQWNDIILEKAYYINICNYFYYLQMVVHMDMMATVLQGGVAEPSLFNSTSESNGSARRHEHNKGILGYFIHDGVWELCIWATIT